MNIYLFWRGANKTTHCLSFSFLFCGWMVHDCELRPLPRPPPFLFHRDRECAPSNAQKPPRRRWEGTKRPLVAAESPWLSARRGSERQVAVQNPSPTALWTISGSARQIAAKLTITFLFLFYQFSQSPPVLSPSFCY